MDCHKLRTVASVRKIFTLAVGLTLLAAIACTPIEAAYLEGVLQNVDALNGEITILTKDGKTLTLTIATEAPVVTEGSSSALSDQLALLPAQQDATVSRWDRFIGVRHGKVEAVWDIQARGCHS